MLECIYDLIKFWPQSVPTAGETNFGENWGSGNGILLPNCSDLLWEKNVLVIKKNF